MYVTLLQVAFKDGDVIINVEEAGEGWYKVWRAFASPLRLTARQGTNKLTGKHGMLPSNYIEKRS